MAINMARRKAVMERSIKLGHCVCNPKKPCPCDIFKEYNVCTCAGERMPVKTGNILLTRYVRKAGCASKIGQADLKRILSHLPDVDNPNVLLGAPAGDDAGIYQIDQRYNLVQTVDVFSPNVNDPYLFGQIAAANSVSDVYAMGGTPISALSIIGFPIEDLDGSIMEEMLCGGLDKMKEARCAVIGGHSINDEEIKMGFAVTGLIDTKNIKKRDAAQVGDVLVLTKPLGTGMVSFATQIGRINEECLGEAGRYMATLNKDAAELMIQHGAHACTDVTGFALMGHLVEMLRGSNVSAEIDMTRIPVFAAVEACIANDILPGAIESNMEYAMAWARIDDTSNEKNIPILYDPQTSGGLLVALPEEHARKYLDEMHQRGHTSTSIIGKIIPVENKHKSEVIIVNSSLENFIGDKRIVSIKSKMEAESEMAQEREPDAQKQGSEALSCCAEADEPCCASPPVIETVSTPDTYVGGDSKSASKLEFKKLFGDFMKEVNKEGLLDKRIKKLMAIALSISEHCEPCLRLHLKSALEMGYSKAEIDEAAYMAISFCGAPAMMFYNEICKELGLS